MGNANTLAVLLIFLCSIIGSAGKSSFQRTNLVCSEYYGLIETVSPKPIEIKWKSVEEYLYYMC